MVSIQYNVVWSSHLGDRRGPEIRHGSVLPRGRVVENTDQVGLLVGLTGIIVGQLTNYWRHSET